MINEELLIKKEIEFNVFSEEEIEERELDVDVPCSKVEDYNMENYIKGVIEIEEF